MPANHRRTRLLAGAAALCVSVAVAGQACAQEDSAAKIARLEAQLAELAQQVADLKQQTATADQDLGETCDRVLETLRPPGGDDDVALLVARVES